MKNTENLDFILDIIQKKSDHILSLSDKIDSKVSIIINIPLLLLSGLSLLESVIWGFNLITLGVAMIFISLVFWFYALKLRNYSFAPSIDAIYSDKSMNMSIYDLKNQTIADMKAAYNDNLKIHGIKARCFNWGIFLMITGILIVLINL